MNAYRPQAADIGFILFDVLQAQDRLAQLPALADNADPDLLRQVLEEAGKFVGEVVAPLNRDGDEIGASFKDGAVTMPPGARAAYQAFWQAGWPALSGARGGSAQAVDAVDAVRRALYLLEPELQRSQCAHTLTMDCPAFEVLADPVALEQIIHNLLTNALQAMEQVPASSRTLHLVLTCTATHGTLRVQDTGPGIPPDALAKVFEPFYSTREGGLGLGLSLCETLAIGMGAQLSAANRADQGAELTLHIPLTHATA